VKLPKTIEACHVRILELEKQVALIPSLLARIESLEAQLNQNSQNSNRPPSSDGPKKPKRKAAFTRRFKKQKGGQKGHEGKTLEMVDTADDYQNHYPLHCCCGTDLSEVSKYVKERRQVFDIPPPTLEVTEHINYACVCPDCQQEVSAGFPDNVAARVQYGNGVKSLVVLLNTGFKLPYGKVKTFFSDVFGYGLNESTQITAQQKCYVQLEASEQIIQQRLLDTNQSPVNHFDETGIGINGKNNWLHVCSNDLYTYLFVHPNRGKKALNNADSLLPMYKGWAVHDCWKSYFLFDQCQHVICNAHIIRELQALKERGQIWADRMRDLLLYAYDKSQQGTTLVDNFKFISNQYDRICKMADDEEPPPEYRHKGKKAKQSKGRNLLNRLREYKDAVLAFAKHQIIPFTNNQAERDIRPLKIKLKVAGCFRSLDGAKRYARIQAFISTARKNNLNVFNELLATFNGYNFLTAPCSAK